MKNWARRISAKKALLVGGLAALLAGLAVVASVGMASAATTPGTSAAGSDTSTTKAHSPVTCDNVVMLEQYAAFRQGVIGADAGTRGSTAWATAELAAATASGETDRAAKMQKILDFRGAHPDVWTKRAARLTKFQTKNCG